MALFGHKNHPITRLWDPPILRGSLRRLAEDQRALQHDDAWYTEEHPYAFEIIQRGGPDRGNDAVFMFPVAPQTLRVRREYRQTVRATIGGLFTEERGETWKVISIGGHFGLAPKYGYDSTKREDDLTGRSPLGSILAPELALSGPGWTSRMLRNVFDRYAALKSDPTRSPFTFLVWHDFKTEEHYVVVPQNVVISRTVEKGLMFPFTIELKAIADADSVDINLHVPVFERIARAINDVVGTARSVVNVATSAADSVTGVLGTVRQFFGGVDSVIDEVGRFIAAMDAVVNGARATANIDETFIRSARDNMIQLNQLIESIDGFDMDTRRDYLILEDSYDRAAASSLTQETDPNRFERAGQALSNQSGEGTNYLGDPTIVGSLAALAANSGTPTPRIFGDYASWFPHTVQRTDTLQSLASRFLGNGENWYEIAILNGLREPWFSLSRVPGTIGPGDIIAIPSNEPLPQTETSTRASTPEELYGTDIRLREVASSTSGRPVVDIRIDPATSTDIALITAVPNVEQAIQMRLWTAKEEYVLDNEYGLEDAIGLPNNRATVSGIRLGVRRALKKESRIDRTLGLSLREDADRVIVDGNVVLKGATDVVSISPVL